MGVALRGTRTSSTASHLSSNSAASRTLLSGLGNISQETPLAEETESRSECGVSAPGAGEDGAAASAEGGVPGARAEEAAGEGREREEELRASDRPSSAPPGIERDPPPPLREEALSGAGEAERDSGLGCRPERGVDCEAALEPAADPLREALRGGVLEELLSGVPDLLR